MSTRAHNQTHTLNPLFRTSSKPYTKMIPARGPQTMLVPVETARFWLQSWWARLSTGASREAPVEYELSATGLGT